MNLSEKLAAADDGATPPAEEKQAWNRRSTDPGGPAAPPGRSAAEAPDAPSRRPGQPG